MYTTAPARFPVGWSFPEGWNISQKMRATATQLRQRAKDARPGRVISAGTVATIGLGVTLGLVAVAARPTPESSAPGQTAQQARTGFMLGKN